MRGSTVRGFSSRDWQYIFDQLDLFRGRDVIVIGRNKDPVYAFAFDVTLGGKNNIGTIDLTVYLG
ncbi:MAG TPA: hypothetical protein VEX68_19410 [Bryobacteraceae bacterium]|nr:hypothetical protein [Bryobacteraceae bacterium]